MIEIKEEEKLYRIIGNMEKQINYIQIDLKWLKNLIYVILIVLLVLNFIPNSVLGGII